MRRMVTVILSMACVFMCILCIIVAMVIDDTPPVITVSTGEMTYEEGGNTQELLAGIRAEDEKDGDISDSVRIYNISVMDNGLKALVTYAVYDSSYNLGKATKIVNYVAKPDEKKENAEDDGKKPEDEEKEPSTEQNMTEASTETPEGYEDLPLVSTGDPVIRLNTHEVHIEVGGDFYSMDYVEDAVDDEDSREYLYRNMYLDGTYDTDTAGEYELAYYCVDSNGNVSNFAKLKLIVEKKAEDNGEE